MSDAVVGLIGAVVGGALASGSNWLLEHFRAKREDDRARSRENRELIQVARLLSDELTVAIATMRVARDQGSWPATPVGVVTRHWHEHKGTLARLVSPEREEAWEVVSSAYEALELESRRSADSRHFVDGGAAERWFDETQQQVRTAAGVLKLLGNGARLRTDTSTNEVSEEVRKKKPL